MIHLVKGDHITVLGMKNANLIQQNFCLQDLNWWKVGGAAEYFAAPQNESELKQVLEQAQRCHWAVRVLGGGSNILVSDRGVQGLVLQMSRLKGLQVESEPPHFKATVWAGTSKAELARVFLARKLMPAVFLTGLPGEVGGGVVMNAGVGEARVPREFCEIVDWVRAIHWPSLREYRIPATQIKWEYRSSVPQASVSDAGSSLNASQHIHLERNSQGRNGQNVGESPQYVGDSPQYGGHGQEGGLAQYGVAGQESGGGWQNFIVVQVGVTWQGGEQAEVRQLVQQATKNRVQRQPLRFPSGGSTFKNPLPHKAGQLIEQCGLKGFRYGGAKVSEQHANFIVNDRQATAHDIACVVRHIQHTVKQKTGIILQPEFVHFQ